MGLEQEVFFFFFFYTFRRRKTTCCFKVRTPYNNLVLVTSPPFPDRLSSSVWCEYCSDWFYQCRWSFLLVDTPHRIALLYLPRFFYYPTRKNNGREDYRFFWEQTEIRIWNLESQVGVGVGVGVQPTTYLGKLSHASASPISSNYRYFTVIFIFDGYDVDPEQIMRLILVGTTPTADSE